MTIDEEILTAARKLTNDDEIKRINALSVLAVGSSKYIKDKTVRQKKLRESNALKAKDKELFNQMEIEACETLVSTPKLLWWLENVLLPMTEMPDDDGQITLSEETRRKQIEAKTCEKLLELIYSKIRRH